MKCSKCRTSDLGDDYATAKDGSVLYSSCCVDLDKCIVCPKCQESSLEVDAVEDVYWCDCGYIASVDYAECPKKILRKLRE